MLMLLLAVCIGLDVARELCFKQSARISSGQSRSAGPSHSLALLPLHTTWVGAGLLCWGIEILGWVLVLARLPLNIAFPIMSLTYAATPVASWLLLGDSISPRRWAGIGLVTAGVAIVGSAGVG